MRKVNGPIKKDKLYEVCQYCKDQESARREIDVLLEEGYSVARIYAGIVSISRSGGKFSLKNFVTILDNVREDVKKDPFDTEITPNYSYRIEKLGKRSWLPKEII